MVYFEELLEEEIKNPQPHEFSGLESTDEIVEKIRENTLNSLEEETSFMKEFPNPIYAFMRLDYLSENEEESLYEMLVDLYMEKKLLSHLMEIQRRASRFMKLEKPNWMKAWNIESEDDPTYWAMISALKEVIIKEVFEA